MQRSRWSSRVATTKRASFDKEDLVNVLIQVSVLDE